jgi:hypothetical protein
MSGLRRSLISAGPKIEIAAHYSDPDLICRKSSYRVGDNMLLIVERGYDH